MISGDNEIKSLQLIIEDENEIKDSKSTICAELQSFFARNLYINTVPSTSVHIRNYDYIHMSSLLL